ncbi:MAG TPA: nucleotide pyrophosphohydrolase [Kiritimatiellia bacterium]|nr:nucleotide pyrophosphohydrolase [Kiritimatiellia bacterium]HNS81007.1 nucleotide pyrophosphohydrolase [Kiritimatiellia bacterium]HPA77997.1 nucleotide pyrophosphohydrolase [Kiritimatiellia bacterium]HQQ04686.1 nucleotide pyrophosphohydrolase [Kiritimatiellia bacterium]
MEALIRDIKQFAQERDWEQYHSPRNLIMALSVEVAEVMEHFLWLTGEQSRNLPEKKKNVIMDEIGDVQILLAHLADQMGIDPIEAARQKLVKNRAKYPADKVRGKALKYTEYLSVE